VNLASAVSLVDLQGRSQDSRVGNPSHGVDERPVTARCAGVTSCPAGRHLRSALGSFISQETALGKLSVPLVHDYGQWTMEGFVIFAAITN
jgi:hypothetical protein